MKKIVKVVAVFLALNAFCTPNASPSMADNSVSQSATKQPDVKSMAGHGNMLADSTKQAKKDTVQHSQVNQTESSAPGGVQTPAENNMWLYVAVVLALVGGAYFAFARLRKK